MIKFEVIGYASNGTYAEMVDASNKDEALLKSGPSRITTSFRTNSGATMNKELRNDLKVDADMCQVRAGKRAAKNFMGKTMQGVRGGCFGPMTATDAHIKRNIAVRNQISEVMFGHGFVIQEKDDMMVKYTRGKETVKFILITIEDAPGYSTFWWVLS